MSWPAYVLVLWLISLNENGQVIPAWWLVALFDFHFQAFQYFQF